MLSHQSPYAQKFSQTYNGSFPKNKIINTKGVVSPHNEKVGHYISKDKRDKISEEIRGAHFKFGFDKEKLHSVFKDSFKEAPIQPAINKDEFMRLSQNNKKSNFELGTTKSFNNQTTNLTFYSLMKESPQKEAKVAEVTTESLKTDLRKEHFSFGSDKQHLHTTNKDLAMIQEKDMEVHKNEKKKNELLKNDMRGHHFSHGNATPIYSSMTKMQFKQYDLGQVYEQKMFGKINSKRMRNTNNIFLQNPELHNRFRSSSAASFEQGEAVSPNKESETNKVFSNPCSPLRKSHIDLGKSNENLYVTQFKSIYGGSSNPSHYLASFQHQEEIDKLQKDLRMTHIKLGHGSPAVKASSLIPTQKEHFKGCEIKDNTEEKQTISKLQTFLKREKFQFGEQSNAQKAYPNFYSSVYKVQTESDKYKNGRPAQKADCDARIGSLNLGTHSSPEQTEAKSSFQAKFSQDAGVKPFDIDKFSSKIQKHNFELHYSSNNKPVNHFQSVASQSNQLTQSKSYYFNQQQEKLQSSKLKEYLVQSHLSMGSFVDHKRSSSQSSYILTSPNKQRLPSQNVNHFQLGNGKPDFQTNSKTQYTWIQPKPQI